MPKRARSSSILQLVTLAFAGCAFGALLAQPACNTSGFRDAYMALDGSGNRKRDVFSTDTDAIFCVAELSSGTADVSVVARVRVWADYDPSTGEPLSRAGDVIGVEEQAPGVGADISTSFVIEKPMGSGFYPAGQYTCDLYLDGDLEESLPFEVRYPDCPFQPIAPAAPCAGVVLLGSECPSPAGGFCSCVPETGIWNCN
ncbi:MAG TPA: hypothetical protein VMG12_11775 [Polyangiaceae bacterium]|nr:hypothetical protein [Polyangiaceae bacterium]